MTDETKPMTKADIRLLDDCVAKIHGRLEKVEADVCVIKSKVESFDGAVDRLGTKLDARFERLERRIDRGFESVNEYIDRMLNFLESGDNRLKQHGERIKELEVHAGIAA